MRLIFFLLVVFSYSNHIFASDWDKVRERGLIPGKTYDISSGTGFYVSENLLITNEHVVQKCLNISVRGAVPPSAAEILITDKKNDLAILKTSLKPKQYARFSDDMQEISWQDKVFVAGYPLEHSSTGKELISEAKIVVLDFINQEEIDQIEFTAQIEKGNSGGPLINNSGNVIGIIQARKNYYYLSAGNYQITNESKPYQVHGLAIGLSRIIKFLNKNFISYSIGNDYTSNSYNVSNSKNYIVNIHCIKNK